MQSQNGHSDRHLGDGGKGEPVGLGSPVRSMLRTVRKMAEHGELAADEVPGVIQMLKRIIDETKSPRERVAAAKTLASLVKLGLDADAILDKAERLDSESPTEISVTYGDAKGGRAW